MRQVLIAAGAAGAWALGGWASQAAAACTGLGCACSVDATALAFGTYDTLALTATDATGNVSVTCSGLAAISVSYEVALSDGGATTYAGRRLASGAGALSYQLYSTAARTSVWGNGQEGTVTRGASYSLSVLFNRTDNFPVYGRIPAGQNVAPGTYSDNVTVTVTF